MKILYSSNKNTKILVDDEDYLRLILFYWNDRHNSIARQKRMGSKTTIIPIANEVMENFDVMFDHKDRNKYNNQKSNLRISSASQNGINRTKVNKPYTSKHKGISFNTKAQKWIAQITCENKHVFIGSFQNEIEASKAYNETATKLFGEFAVLNDI